MISGVYKFSFTSTPPLKAKTQVREGWESQSAQGKRECEEKQNKNDSMNFNVCDDKASNIDDDGMVLVAMVERKYNIRKS